MKKEGGGKVFVIVIESNIWDLVFERKFFGLF